MKHETGITEINQINTGIVACTRCPRLIPYIQEVAKTKVRRFREQQYWGKPVPGFGDPLAKLLIIGLAPAAHGANRTGRMFTGDSSGDWLYRALYETGFASQAESVSKDDGLELRDCYIVSIARCAPPKNKPSTEEIGNCSTFLQRELNYFENAPVVLCLGGLAFKQFCKLKNLKGLKFGHGHKFQITNNQTLISSYHPSRQNTNTGKLKWGDWLGVFADVRKLV